MPISSETINPLWAHLRDSPRTRRELGRSQRASVPLEAHAEVVEAPRADPLSILARQDKSRLAELIPLRYGRMSRSPFTFLRGAAAVMAGDLAAGSRTDLWVELCGDAHLGNFRWYHAPDRELVFDLNDFDETLPGPFEWDVKRLAASVTVSARNNGFSKNTAREATRSAMRSYREFITETSDLSPVDLHYYRSESQQVLENIQRHGKKLKKWKKEVLRRAVRKNSLLALNKLTAVVDGRRVIVPDPPLVVRVDDELAASSAEAVAAFFDNYRDSLPLDRRMLIDRFSLVDVAQ